jgi:hypothetical protein
MRGRLVVRRWLMSGRGEILGDRMANMADDLVG